jgi:hypothetical protein
MGVIDGVGSWLFGGLIGFLIAMACSLSMDFLHIKKKDANSEEKGVADEFEKIWSSANNKALEALILYKDEYPIEKFTEEDKKFIDEKREKYICDMIALYQLKVEEE